MNNISLKLRRIIYNQHQKMKKIMIKYPFPLVIYSQYNNKLFFNEQFNTFN